jgi:hypothetical protein
MKTPKQITGNEQGSVLLLALLMLFAVTMLGLFSTNTSTIEIQVSANNAFKKKAFYAAEAGLEHGRSQLTALLIPNNQALLAAAQDPVWTFALDGSNFQNAASLNGNTNKPDYENGADLFPAPQQIGDCTYTVRVYDDWEGDGDAATDTNGRIHIRSVAEGPRGAQAAVEAILVGDVIEEQSTDYTAQAGAGSAKSSIGQDKNAVDASAVNSNLSNKKTSPVLFSAGGV